MQDPDYNRFRSRLKPSGAETQRQCAWVGLTGGFGVVPELLRNRRKSPCRSGVTWDRPARRMSEQGPTRNHPWLFLGLQSTHLTLVSTRWLYIRGRVTSRVPRFHLPSAGLESGRILDKHDYGHGVYKNKSTKQFHPARIRERLSNSTLVYMWSWRIDRWRIDRHRLPSPAACKRRCM